MYYGEDEPANEVHNVESFDSSGMESGENDRSNDPPPVESDTYYGDESEYHHYDDVGYDYNDYDVEEYGDY